MIVYFFSFLLTINVEFLIIYLITRLSWKELLWYIILINCFTWPLANIAYVLGASFYLVELAVILIESILLWKLLNKKYLAALGLSLIANGITASLSFVL